MMVSESPMPALGSVSEGGACASFAVLPKHTSSKKSALFTCVFVS
jgi:hypothetical protein